MVAMGERMKGILKEKGWTQNDLADALGVTHATVSRYIHGRTPPSDMVETIARELNVSTDYLYGLTDDPTPPGHGRFDPNDEDWRDHPECPRLLKELDEDPDFDEYLENPRTRGILTGIAFHRGEPNRGALLRFLEYALFIEEKEARKQT